MTARLDEIDSLRALAMTAVVAEHCRILPCGWLGVWLFFVISGFVVTTSLISRPADDPPALLARFYARRAARILPIYLAYVTVGFVVSGLAIGHLEWSPFASLVLFYNNIQSALGAGTFKAFPVAHLWTISVEMQFYLFFGFAFFFLPRRLLAGTLIALIFIAPLLRYVGGDWLLGAGLSPLRAAFAVYTFAPMHFDSFAAGALLALGADRWRRPAWAGGLLLGGGLLIGAYAITYVLMNRAGGAVGVGMFRNVISGIMIGENRQVWVYSALAALFAGVLATTLTGSAPWAAVTRSPFLQAVGRASYGGYVYHVLCVRAVRSLLSPAAGLTAKLTLGVAEFILAMTATVILSLVSYRYVERPIIARVNGWLTGPPRGVRPAEKTVARAAE